MFPLPKTFKLTKILYNDEDRNIGISSQNLITCDCHLTLSLIGPPFWKTRFTQNFTWISDNVIDLLFK